MISYFSAFLSKLPPDNKTPGSIYYFVTGRGIVEVRRNAGNNTIVVVFAAKRPVPCTVLLRRSKINLFMLR